MHTREAPDFLGVTQKHESRVSFKNLFVSFLKLFISELKNIY